jgi:hypothetical protein
MLLHPGDHDRHVETLQRRLKAAGAQIAVDGWYGDATEAAVRAYQAKHDLVADGIAGPRTWDALTGTWHAKALQQSDLAHAAATLNVELAAVQAVTEIEANNSGFDAPNRPKILFERHIMRRQMQQRGLATAAAEKAHPDIVNKQPGGYQGGLGEHIRLVRALRICQPAAPESASWGLFQIMGFHWDALGYASPYAFAEAMSQSEANQLDAFVRFIAADDNLHKALAEKHWADFAHGYNGPDYTRNHYDVRLQRAYQRHTESNGSQKAKPKKTRKKTTKTQPANATE